MILRLPQQESVPFSSTAMFLISESVAQELSPGVFKVNAEFVTPKLSDSSMVGANYLKSLRAPLPEINLIPTGSVNFSTAADYLKDGACAFGVGSDLVDVKALSEGHENEIIDNSKRYLEIVKTVRNS